MPKFIVPMDMAPGVARATQGLCKPGQVFVWPDENTKRAKNKWGSHEAPSHQWIPVDKEGFDLLSEFYADDKKKLSIIESNFGKKAKADKNEIEQKTVQQVAKEMGVDDDTLQRKTRGRKRASDD